MQSYLAQGDRLTMPDIDYLAVMPLLVVFIGAVVAVLFECVLPKHQRWTGQVALTVVTLAGAAIALGAYLGDAPAEGVTTFRAADATSGALAVDAPTLFLWGTLIIVGLGAVLLIADRSVEPGGAFLPQRSGPGTVGPVRTDEHKGVGVMRTEIFPLTLFSLGGMMAFVAANDLLTMFVALEVLSLPLYLMAGLARRRRLMSQEAAVKYFLLGAFASAFFLYGVALLYGYAGSVKLAAIADAATVAEKSDILLFAGMALIVVGLLFKGSVGPFHTWTPDVYQGAPTPVTAFMAACTKIAAFGAMLRVLHVAFEGASWEAEVVLWIIAIISMGIGAILALTQRDVKRMIAYSSIAHAGFLVIGAITLTADGLAATLFYLLAYGLSTIAVFGIISLVRDADGEATDLSSWAGLAKRSPLVAAVFTFLLLALAGIPLTSGFVGKFTVFTAAFADGKAALVVIGLVASAIAAFFYLRVVVVMYFSEPAEQGPSVVIPGVFTTAAVTIGTLATLVLGVVPTFALNWAGAGGFWF